MYLTRMELNTANRQTIMALSSPAKFHGAIETSFPSKGGRLWRIDTLGDRTFLLLVSETAPDLTRAAQQFGRTASWNSIDYDSFLAQIKGGEQRRFMLKANPVIAKCTKDTTRGRVLAHVTTEQQEQWLYQRAEKNGFQLKSGEFSVVQTAWVSFYKGGNRSKRVEFKTATFEGLLTVTDPELLRHAMTHGIGREKAYGCGMLTLTRSL